MGRAWETVNAWPRRGWAWRFESNRNKRIKYAPRFPLQWLAITLATAFALAYELAQFGLLAGDWAWPWVRVRELNGSDTSLACQASWALPEHLLTSPPCREFPVCPQSIVPHQNVSDPSA